MTLKGFYRLLVVLELFVPMCGIIYRLCASITASEESRNLLAWHGYGAMISDPLMNAGSCITLVLAVLVLTGVLAVQVGLFFFRPWARSALLLLAGLRILAAVAFGISIQLPVEAACYEFGNLACGAVLALTYFSPLRHSFVGPSESQGVMTATTTVSDAP